MFIPIEQISVQTKKQYRIDSRLCWVVAIIQIYFVEIWRQYVASNEYTFIEHTCRYLKCAKLVDIQSNCGLKKCVVNDFFSNKLQWNLLTLRPRNPVLITNLFGETVLSSFFIKILHIFFFFISIFLSLISLEESVFTNAMIIFLTVNILLSHTRNEFYEKNTDSETL